MALHPDFIAELRRNIAGDLRLELADRILYSTDASIYQIEPLGVFVPRGQEDLHAAVELAARHGVPVLPRGAGTSLAGQAIGEALILDCSRWLDRIIEIDPEARTATVEPGVILADLNRAAHRHGLQFGPDPASAERATMAGVIANNATGAHSITHGMTADHLLAAEVILAGGTLETWAPGRDSAMLPAVLDIRTRYGEAIRRSYPSTWRNSAGYRLNYLLGWSPDRPPEWGDRPYAGEHVRGVNLAPLLAGSEGTLAVIRRATVNLVARPAETLLAILDFEDVPSACDAVPGLLRHHPSAIELVPQMLVRLARQIPAYAAQMGWVRGDPAALLVVEFSGDLAGVLKERAQALRSDVLLAESADEQAQVWAIRKAGLGLLDSSPTGRRPVAFIEDCAVPVEHLGEFVREVEKILAAHDSQAAFYAHASAGCLHIRPVLDLQAGSGRRSLRSIAAAVLALTLRLGGSMSSEHGDGLARAEFLERTYGGEIMAAFRLLKRAADPRGLLNPNKLVDAPPMDTHLRYDGAYKTAGWPTGLDFSRNGGLARAIEQCNGQGVCRKAGGVMCPSFQATREEMHSTRGRANLLRALIAQPEPARTPGLELACASALDLCLACKGCKAECPSGVDMAKLKQEFQARYYESHRRPARDYLFGYFNELARIGAPFASIYNWAAMNAPLRRVTGRLLGITDQRPLPRYGRAARRTGSNLDKANESCLYLRDSFSHFFEPEIEQAALEVLAACGVSTRLLPGLGAGRTLLSKGFLVGAKRRAAAVLDAIHRLDPSSRMPIVGVEPSEIYTLRDEFIDLLPARRDEAQALAGRAFMLDEYLIRRGNDGEKRIMRVVSNSHENIPSRVNPRLALHGHCYQKTQPPAQDLEPVGQAATVEFLRTLGHVVEVIPSGCCGMSGAFGYEADHYDLSVRVGELALLPAAREFGRRHFTLVAAGFSCRSQISDQGGLHAVHPIVLARDTIAGARASS